MARQTPFPFFCWRQRCLQDERLHPSGSITAAHLPLLSLITSIISAVIAKKIEKQELYNIHVSHRNWYFMQTNYYSIACMVPNSIGKTHYSNTHTHTHTMGEKQDKDIKLSRNVMCFFQYLWRRSKGTSRYL